MAQQSPPPSDNVYISNIPSTASEQDLQTIFGPYGTIVSMKVNQAWGPKTSCMIRFSSVDEAKWLVENLNGNFPEGLTEAVTVRFANAPGGGGKGGGKNWNDNSGGGGGWNAHNGWQTQNQSPGKGGANSNGWETQNQTQASGAPAPSEKLWIGDLPGDITEAKLKEVFGAYGTINFTKMLTPKDGKLSAIVGLGSVEEAQWMVDNLNGNIPEGLQDNPVIVKFATENKGKGKGKDGAAPYGKGGCWGKGDGKGDGKSKGGKPDAAGSIQAVLKGAVKGGVYGPKVQTVPDECQCYVRNLPSDTTDLELYKLFAPFGAIHENGVKAMMNPDGTCKGIGFVDFKDATSAATAATTLDNFQSQDGAMIQVAIKNSTKGKGGCKGKGK